MSFGGNSVSTDPAAAHWQPERPPFVVAAGLAAVGVVPVARGQLVVNPP